VSFVSLCRTAANGESISGTMERLATYTRTIEDGLLARAFLAHGLAGYVAKADQSLRELHFQRCVGRSVADTLLKGAVTSLDTSTAIGALRPSAAAFLGMVNRVSVLGRLAEALRVPPNTHGRLQATNPTAMWVEEGGRKPITSMGFNAMDLAPRKVVSGFAVSAEFTRAVEAPTLDSLTQSLTSAVAVGTDTAAFDPSNAGSAGTPASLTNGATEVASTGDLAGDIDALLAAISDGAATAPYVIHTQRAARMATMVAGLREQGVRVLRWPNASDLLIAVDATGVAIAEDETRIVVGTQADLLMDDGSSPPSTTVLRLFQANMISVMAERSLNWTVRPGAVAWMAGAGSSA
jgi:hypothetical protein